ncbi:copper-binding protein [Mesorhizobium australicum]|uniref:Cu and Ag efflux protein CusF n=1 Tax=Mesorhizobium australicum TaxID=536018 RepID=A0A1X7MQC3_9HYPH|nr:copper-binding protein [Mesorhizobium australicum]SMH26173.1 Cu and Ag efflux protein CusF [Mesorhizobium australicum]
MKKTLTAFTVLMLAYAGSAFAAEYTKGEVTKVDIKQKKITIKHEPLTNLDMPAMTMVFVVADDAMLEKVKPGQAIEFVADRVNGRITVVEIK